MKLKQRWVYGPDSEISVQNAVEVECSGRLSSGELETARDRLDALIGVVARTLQVLHDEGRISDDGLLRILTAVEKL